MIETLFLPLLLLLWPFAPPPASPPQAPISADVAAWVEGEDAVQRRVQAEARYGEVDRALLSQGAWLFHAGLEEGRASYAFDIAAAGRYTLWWRGNIRGEVLFSLDGAPHLNLPFGANTRAPQPLDASGSRVLAWARAGDHDLRAGSHSLSFILRSTPPFQHGAIDCFCLARAGFEPHGSARPAQGTADLEAWPAVDLAADNFAATSVTDLSATLPSPAGKAGVLQRKGAELHFEQEAGPVRFFGLSCDISPETRREELSWRARYFAKIGANLARQADLGKLLGPLVDGEFDAKRLDVLDRWFFELKGRGIYSAWTLFSPLILGPAERYIYSAELPQTPEGRDAAGFAVFMEPLQEIQLQRARALLLHRNIYTGLRYAEDPALALLSLWNEDSLFWHHPLSALAGDEFPQHRRHFGELWARWVKQHYASEADLVASWGGSLRPGESWQGGGFAIYGAFELGANGPRDRPRERRRAGDYLRFLAELQRGGLETLTRELRRLGYRGLIASPATRSGSEAGELLPAWCDGVADIVDRRALAGGGAGGMEVRAGLISHYSPLHDVRGLFLAAGLQRVEGRPFACLEWALLPPDPYAAEAGPLVACYGLGLQGWNAACHLLTSLAPQGGPAVLPPATLLLFPALSRAVREGHFTRGATAALTRLAEEDLFFGMNPLKEWHPADPLPDSTDKGAWRIPAAGLALGQVGVAFDGSRGEAPVRAQGEPAGTLLANTGELAWNPAQGWMELRAARTQGAAGRLAGRSLDLPDLRLECASPFAVLLVTSWDGTPIQSSARLLLSAVARQKLTGTRMSADETQLLETGRPPARLEPVRARLHFKERPPRAVRVLDVHGVPSGGLLEVAPDGWISLPGLPPGFLFEVLR